MAWHYLTFERMAKVRIPIAVEASSKKEAVEVASEKILTLPTHDWQTIEGQPIQKKDFWAEGTR